MTIIKPESTINLYEGILNGAGTRPVFTSFENQKRYFEKHKRGWWVGCSYIKHSRNELKVNFNPQVVQNCNYISFRNPNFENWEYYAEIISYEYISNEVCKIKYEIDWFQSYMFAVTYQESFIEKQHLLEKTYKELEKNPWLDIYEMHTDENIPVSDSMFEGSRRDDSEFAVHFGPPCYVMKVSPHDINSSFIDQWTVKARKMVAQSLGFIKDSRGVENHFIPMDIHGNDLPESYIDFKYPKVENPCDIIVLPNTEGARETLRELLDFLALSNMSGAIVGLWTVPKLYISNWLLWNSSNQGEARPSVLREDTIKSDFKATKASDLGGRYTVKMALPTTTYHNKKLLRSPYTYMFVEADGNRKEWRFEDFRRYTPDGKKVMFDIIASFDNAPFISLCPYAYQRTHPDISDSRVNVNIAERLDIINIPQMSYSMDAYLAFLGNQYTSQLASTTTKAANMKRESVTTDGYRSQGALPLTQKFRETLGALYGGKQRQADVINNDFMRDAGIWNEIEDYNNGKVNGDYVSGVFGNAKSLYALDEYHAGSGNVLGAYTGPTYNVPSGFTYGYNTLRPSIGNTIDKYFDYYGYTCNYIGVPRIVNYIQGGDLPHFVNNQTYCKTTNMRVTHSLKVVCDYIEAIFNNGCHFYRGENL